MFGTRRPQHLLDARGAGRQHDQSIEAERYSASRRHHREGAEKILIDRIALAVDALLLRHLLLEPLALLAGIGELAEAVREFDPAGVKLEPFGKPRIGTARLGERRLYAGIFVKDRRPPEPETGLDLLDQQPAENIAPVVVGGGADTGG